VSRVVADETAAFAEHEGDCLLCTTVDEERAAGHRLLDDHDGAVVLSPYWAGSPYELLVLPTTHGADVKASAPADVVGVGRGVRDGLRRIRSLLGDVPYNLILHTAPHDHDGPYHWHVHVIPRVTSVAGFEQGTGALINIVAPELAAQQLRRQSGPQA
jgi:UDPglucose--hexose-1-phosphate uridylyltransferase